MERFSFFQDKVVLKLEGSLGKLLSESYKDKFDQLHHMQVIAHVLILSLLQYFNAHLKSLESRPERMMETVRIFWSNCHY